jgi:GNAT superfamily N-acetyltransferase
MCPVNIRPLHDTDRSWLAETVTQEWGLPVVSISGVHDPRTLPGFVAEEDARPVGVVTYRTTRGECEVVTLNSLLANQGVGTALLGAVRQVADAHGLRLWLITTDENTHAIRFYEHRGMTRRALHRDFVDTVRRHKAGPHGAAQADGYRDAIEFSY